MLKAMKKILFFAALAAIAASCVNESYETEKYVINASIEQTKTALDGVKTNWTAGDELTVFNADKSNCKFTTAIESASATAAFTYTGAFQVSANTCAFYPYNQSIATQDFATFTGLEIPEIQTPVENGFDPTATLCFARVQSENVTFQNLTALLKFTVNADEVYNVRIYAAGSKIAGTCTFDGTALTASANQVQLKGVMRKGKTFYMAVAPGAYTSLSVYVNNEPYSDLNRENKTLEAGKIYDMGMLGNNRRSIVDWYYASDVPSTFTAEDLPEQYRANINDVNKDDPFQQTDAYSTRGARYKIYLVSEDGKTLICGDTTHPVDWYLNENKDGQIYAVHADKWGQPLYFNIDWETKYNGEAGKFPLVCMRDRCVNYVWQSNRSYYDSNTRTLRVDLATEEGGTVKLFHGQLSKTK